MSRLPFAILVSVLVSSPLAAQPAAKEGGKLSIRWHGQSFYEIRTSAGTRIVIDPHAIEAYGPKLVKADLILFTHPHSDHTQFQAVENWQKVKVIGGVKDAGGRQVTWNNVDEKFKDVHIRTVGTFHDTMNGMRRGLNSVIILEVDGFRIVHLGDLGHLLSAAQVREIGAVDVLMIPVGGVYTINGSEAKDVVAQLKPRYLVLPMHHGTRVYQDLLGPEEFLEDQKNVKKYTTNEISLDVGQKPPEEPSIALLTWADR